MKGICRVCKKRKKMRFFWADKICKKCFEKETTQPPIRITVL